MIFDSLKAKSTKKPAADWIMTMELLVGHFQVINQVTLDVLALIQPWKISQMQKYFFIVYIFYKISSK